MTSIQNQLISSNLQGVELWRNDPIRFVKDVFDVRYIEKWQEQALWNIANHEIDHGAIRSGHGVGKTTLLSWIIFWWLSTRYPALIACTAPTAHQLEDILWGEAARWHQRMKPGMKRNFTVVQGKITLINANFESYCVARTARKENPEAFQGFHSPNMLFLVDEASGVEEIIFEVGAGAMSTKGAKSLMTGNPTRTSGKFFNAFHKNRSDYWTMKVSCFDSTQATLKYVEKMRNEYGEDSNIYRIRVLGEFPLENDNTVIPLHLLEASVCRDVAVYHRPVVWGVDVARFGDDRSALAKRQGNVLLEPVKWWRKLDTMQTCGVVAKEYHETPDHKKPVSIYVDVIGLGAGVVDRLHELGLPAFGVNVAEAPSNKELYLRLRDELWFTAREWFDNRDTCIPDDSLLIQELGAPIYQLTSAGKIQVESKSDMKARGLLSPDVAEAFLMTLAGGEHISGWAQARAEADYDIFDPLGLRPRQQETADDGYVEWE